MIRDLIKLIIQRVMKLSIMSLAVLFAVFSAGRAEVVQNPDNQKLGVRNFIDEDGDGFNDLLPDLDGDGVPDGLDPDFQGHHADSAFMWQHMNGMNGMNNDGMMPNFMNGGMFMGPHGEPGQFGPGDSTSHGGMHGGGDMDSSGMGGGGGMMGGGKIDPAYGNPGGPKQIGGRIEKPILENEEIKPTDKNAKESNFETAREPVSGKGK